MADATGTTVMAEARGAARQRLYRRFGFQTVAEVGGAAIIVRQPREPRGAERPSSSPQSLSSLRSP
jgi:hypothetical protein